MKHSSSGLQNQTNSGLIRLPLQLLLWAALCLPFALNATVGEGNMQPASPQATERAISPVQSLASAESVTFEGGSPAGHGSGHPCAGHGGHPCGS